MFYSGLSLACWAGGSFGNDDMEISQMTLTEQVSELIVVAARLRNNVGRYRAIEKAANTLSAEGISLPEETIQRIEKVKHDADCVLHKAQDLMRDASILHDIYNDIALIKRESNRLPE